MRRLAWFIFLPAVLSALSFALEPQLAVGYRDEIRILDLNSREIRCIHLPARLETGFSMRDGVVVFYGDDFRMHWYQVEENRELPLAQGPYLYAGKAFGPELCRNLDLDPSGGQLVFEVKPLWIKTNTAALRRDFDDLDEYAEICLLDAVSGKFRRLSGGRGYVWRPWIRHGYLIFSSPAGVGIRRVNSPQPLGLNRIFASRNPGKSEVFLESLALEGKELVVAEYAGSDLKFPRVIAIWAFHLERESWRLLHQFTGKDGQDVPEVSMVTDISPDFQYLLLQREAGEWEWLRLDSRARRGLRTGNTGPAFVRFTR